MDQSSALRLDGLGGGHPEIGHDALRLRLLTAGRDLRLAVDDPQRFAEARARLTAFLVDEVLAHLAEDEPWLLAAEQQPDTRLLAQVTRAEILTVEAAVEDIVSAAEYEAVGATRVVHTLLAVHDLHMRLLHGSHRPDSASA
jgi:hypothetical protein